MKKMSILLLALLVLLTGCSSTGADSDSEISLTDNQKFVYVMVANIQGNEMTYNEVDESVAEQSEKKRSNESKQSDESKQSEDFTPPENGTLPEKAAMDTTESVTTMIPVGIAVHTTADTITSFQRIKTGDLLKMLLETDDQGKQVITEIWMLS